MQSSYELSHSKHDLAEGNFHFGMLVATSKLVSLTTFYAHR